MWASPIPVNLLLTHQISEQDSDMGWCHVSNLVNPLLSSIIRTRYCYSPVTIGVAREVDSGCCFIFMEHIKDPCEDVKIHEAGGDGLRDSVISRVEVRMPAK